jgi:exopolysaccharide biosynthesis protein
MPIRVLTILVLCLAGFIQASQQTIRGADERIVDPFASGIEHILIKRGDFSTEPRGDRWTIHALIVDSKHARLKLAQAMDEVAGAETTSSMAARHGALAAINGGYFRTTGIARGEPVGALTINGKVLSEPVRNRAALAVKDDGKQVRVAITHFTMTAELRVDGKAARAISGINRPREKDELVVFTPEFHRTTLTDPDGLEALVERNRVTAIFDDTGSRLIPPGGFVISATGAAHKWARANLRRGSRVEIKTKTNAEPEISFTPDFIIGGGPQLISSGKQVFVAEAARYSESLYRQRHPRTAIGWRADGKLVLITVDGRQNQSVGMTMEELAGLMLELGCIEAMNLDGGGSTAMVVKNKVVNHPSDATGERQVSDALMLFPR